MISWLEKGFCYQFPQPIPLTKTMMDYLDEDVDEKYYLKTEKAEKLVETLVSTGALEREREREIIDLNLENPKTIDICPTLGTVPRGIQNNRAFKEVGVCERQYGRIYDANGASLAICSRDYKEPKKIMVVGNMNATGEGFESSNRIYSPKGIAPCLNTSQGGGREPFIMSDAPVCLNSKGGRGGVEGLQPSLQDRIYSTEAVSVAISTGYHPQYLTTNRIRKLTETECLRLMGVTEEDIGKIKAEVSPTQCYKQAGNSIVVDVMVAIFDNLFNTAETGGQMSIYDYL